MIKSKKIKKGKYKFVRKGKIPIEYIYQKYNPQWHHLVKTYFKDSSLLFRNSPICDCAMICLQCGDESIVIAKDIVFVKYQVALYTEAGELKEQDIDQYKINLIRRLLKTVTSIKKHGYAKGKYKDRLVCVLESGPSKYEIISGKHRAAAIIAMGNKRMLCNVYREIKK